QREEAATQHDARSGSGRKRSQIPLKVISSGTVCKSSGNEARQGVVLATGTAKALVGILRAGKAHRLHLQIPVTHSGCRAPHGSHRRGRAFTILLPYNAKLSPERDSQKWANLTLMGLRL